MINKKPAIFLDRDGVINRDDAHHPWTSGLEFIPEAVEAICFAREKSLPVFIVTNQGGISLGLFNEAEVHAFHRRMIAVLEASGGLIADILFCPHHPLSEIEAMRDCACRKPKPGMILELAAKHNITLSRSILIGDRASDIEAGESAGCRSFLYLGDSLLELMKKAIHYIEEINR